MVRYRILSLTGLTSLSDKLRSRDSYGHGRQEQCKLIEGTNLVAEWQTSGHKQQSALYVQ